MPLNLPLWLRRTIYAVTIVGTPVVAYLRSQGLIGDNEVHLWEGLVTVASGVALFHSTDTNQATVTAPATVEVTATPGDDSEPDVGSHMAD